MNSSPVLQQDHVYPVRLEDAGGDEVLEEHHDLQQEVLQVRHQRELADVAIVVCLRHLPQDAQ